MRIAQVVLPTGLLLALTVPLCAMRGTSRHGPLPMPAAPKSGCAAIFPIGGVKITCKQITVHATNGEDTPFPASKGYAYKVQASGSKRAISPSYTKEVATQLTPIAFNNQPSVDVEIPFEGVDPDKGQANGKPKELDKDARYMITLACDIFMNEKRVAGIHYGLRQYVDKDGKVAYDKDNPPDTEKFSRPPGGPGSDPRKAAPPVIGIAYPDAFGTTPSSFVTYGTATTPDATFTGSCLWRGDTGFPGWPAQGHTPPDWKFRYFGVPAGDYLLEVHSINEGGEWATEYRQVTVGAS